MKDCGLTRSTIEPKPIEITENKVFIATDVHQIITETDEHKIQEYEFNLIEYSKDEYIKLISNKNSEIEQTLIDTQMALCDIYESIS